MFHWNNAWMGAKIHILLQAHRWRRPILLCHPIKPDQFYGVPSDHANAPVDAQFRNKEQCCYFLLMKFNWSSLTSSYIVLVLLESFSSEPVNRLRNKQKKMMLEPLINGNQQESICNSFNFVFRGLSVFKRSGRKIYT